MMALVFLRVLSCLSVLLVAQANGVGSSLAASKEPCEGCCPCPGDDEQGQCAPLCQDCVCCPHARPVVLAPMESRTPEGEPSSLKTEAPVAYLPSPFVEEISHVPKRSA
ncbi:MAG: hypothetical protein ACOZIN_18570 [Myxococcota bacterium]